MFSIFFFGQAKNEMLFIYFANHSSLQIALSDLQTRAETEIHKAQKLVSEKDDELFAAEESLSELVEVFICHFAWLL